MFKINYRITTKNEMLQNLSLKEINEGAHIEGYFELVVNKKRYGYCKHGVLFPEEGGMDLLTTWFEGFLNLLVELKKGKKCVVISDIDSFDTWLRFEQLKNDCIDISIIKAEKKENMGQIVTIPLKNVLYGNWSHEVIPHNEMQKEILNKSNQYLREIENINNTLSNGDRFRCLKELIEKIA